MDWFPANPSRSRTPSSAAAVPADLASNDGATPSQTQRIRCSCCHRAVTSHAEATSARPHMCDGATPTHIKRAATRATLLAKQLRLRGMRLHQCQQPPIQLVGRGQTNSRRLPRKCSMIHVGVATICCHTCDAPQFQSPQDDIFVLGIAGSASHLSCAWQLQARGSSSGNLLRMEAAQDLPTACGCAQPTSEVKGHSVA
jgi:hypothetical protein